VVTNTGQRRRSQVVQVYVGGADGRGPIGDGQVAPPRRLEGFAKVSLDPGRSKHVVVTLGPRAFAHWDGVHNAWVQTAGSYTVEIGTSSRDLPLTASVERGGGTVQ
jgi:beta-glucosidase